MRLTVTLLIALTSGCVSKQTGSHLDLEDIQASRISRLELASADAEPHVAEPFAVVTNPNQIHEFSNNIVSFTPPKDELIPMCGHFVRVRVIDSRGRHVADVWVQGEPGARFCFNVMKTQCPDVLVHMRDRLHPELLECRAGKAVYEEMKKLQPTKGSSHAGDPLRGSPAGQP